MLSKTLVELSQIEKSEEKGILLKDGTWLSHDDYEIAGEAKTGRNWTIRPIVPSSMVEYCEYFPDDNGGELQIFKVRGGTPIIYVEVPQYIVLAMALDRSVGRFYNTYIRGRYPLKGQYGQQS